MIESERVPGADSLYVDAGGQRLHYLRAGDGGPPVVLVHGSGVDDAALSWKHAIPVLAEHYRVYAPDWPGYGDSDGPEGTPTSEYFTEVLESFLDAVGIDRAAIVAISMGGGAALGFAVRHPERVRALALVDSYGLRDAVPGGTSTYMLANAPFVDQVGRNVLGASRASARNALGMFVHDTAACDESFVAEVHERLRESSALSSFVAFQRAEFRPDGVRTHYADDLADLELPVLLVHGADDPLLPSIWSKEAVGVLPDATVEVIPDCGHWPPRERPEAFLETLEPFLARTADR